MNIHWKQHTDADGRSYRQIEVPDSCSKVLFELLAEKLHRTMKGRWAERLTGPEQRYWDLECGDGKITLHLEHYLGISIFPTERDNAGAASLEALERAFEILEAYEPSCEALQARRIQATGKLVRPAFRFVFSGTAFGVGWVVYMVGMLLTTYEGFLSLIIQPFIGAIFSGITVALSLLLGLFFRIPALGRWWARSRKPATILASACLGLLTFGYFFGITSTVIHPETRREIVMLHPLAALIGYFGLVFAVANWPHRRRR